MMSGRESGWGSRNLIDNHLKTDFQYQLHKNQSLKKKSLSLFPFFFGSSVLIDCFIYCLSPTSGFWPLERHTALNKLGCGSVSSEIYGGGLQHSAVFGIALPCAVPLRSLYSLLPCIPAFNPASGSSRKTVRPLIPLSGCFCHQRRTIKTTRSCGCSDYKRMWVCSKGDQLGCKVLHNGVI